MPKRTDIKSVMVIGSGPIVIGQAAEFDYSGTQACRVLREEGIRVILVNSNPATIMTDPEMADATYIEPISTPILEQIIAKERPDALLPTLGGQTALNAAMALGEAGVLKKYNVELIGASLEAAVTLYCNDAVYDLLNSIPMDELADLMIVSHVELVKGEGGAASAVEGLGVAAAHATGDKCERCWKYSADIGTHAAHPTLCARCAAVVEG